MMLKEYINSFPRTERKKIKHSIAQKLNISDAYIDSMCNGHRRIPEKWAVALEKATHGKVTRQEICPHLYV